MNNLISSYCCCDDGGGEVVDCLGLVGGDLGRSCDWFPAAWEVSIDGGFKVFNTRTVQGGPFGDEDCAGDPLQGGDRLSCEEIEVSWSTSGTILASVPTGSQSFGDNLLDILCPNLAPGDHCDIMSNPENVAFYRTVCSGGDFRVGDMTLQIEGTRTWNQLLNWRRSSCSNSCLPAGSYTNEFSAELTGISVMMKCFGSPPRLRLSMFSPTRIIPVSGTPPSWPCGQSLLSTSVAIPGGSNGGATGIGDPDFNAGHNVGVSQPLRLADAGLPIELDQTDDDGYSYDCPIGCPDPFWDDLSVWPGFHGCVTRANATITPIVGSP